MRSSRGGSGPEGPARGRAAEGPGFTMMEVLISLTVLAVAILGILSMTATGHGNVDTAGRKTLALIAASQMLEDVRALPFASLINANPLQSQINGINTSQPATYANLTVGSPEYNIARKWRYALAGPGAGFTFTAVELARWSTLSMGAAPAGISGQVSVVNQTPTRVQVTVTVSTPGLWGSLSSLQLSTVVAQTL